MDNSCFYEIKAFSDELGLTAQETASLYIELIDEITAQISEIPSLLKRNDIEAARRTLHNLKGLSSNYRITDLYEGTVKVSQALKDCDRSAEDRAADLVSVWERAKRGIADYFSRQGISIVPGNSLSQSG